MIQQIPNSLPRANGKDQSFKKTGEEKKSVFYFLRALLPSIYSDRHDYARSEDIWGDTKSAPIFPCISLAMRSDHRGEKGTAMLQGDFNLPQSRM